MQHFYYMNNKGGKDGPHDLVTIMRRIHAKKILPDTLVFVGEELTATSAHQVDDLRLFFNRPVDDVRTELQPRSISVGRALQLGWQFTMENNILTVFAGGMLLFAILFASLVGSIFSTFSSPTTSWIVGCATGWIVYFILHNFFIAASLRLYRGQTMGMEVIERDLAPVLDALFLSSVIVSVMVGFGLIFFAVPGLIAFTIYAFVPLVIFDQRYNAIQGMAASRTLMQKMDKMTIAKLVMLATLYVISLPLLIPAPLLLPIFTGALCAIYEEVSSL